MSAKKTNYKPVNKTTAGTQDHSRLRRIMLLLPVFFTVGVIPLLVRMKQYATNMEDVEYANIYPEVLDFFIYWKSWHIVIAAGWMACILIGLLVVRGREIKSERVFWPLAGYALMTIISACASEYQPFPFTGSYEQFENVFVLVGYCMIAYYAFLVVNELEDVDLIFRVLTISTLIILFVAMTQAFGVDFFKTTLGKRILLNDDYFAVRDQMGFAFEPGRVYATFYNPNYVGSYASLMTPVFAMLAVRAEKTWQKIGFGLVTVGIILSLLASESRAGLVGVFAAGLIVVIIFNRKLLKDWFVTALVAILLIGSLVTMNNYSNGALVNKIKGAFSVAESVHDVEDIQTLDTEVRLTYRGNVLHTRFIPDFETGLYEMIPFDDDGYLIDCEEKGAYGYVLTDERFKDIELEVVIIYDEVIGYSITVGGKPWYFYNDGKTYYMYNTYGKKMKARTSETVELLNRYGRMGSGRAALWSRTIPLLKDNLIIGSGPDTFFFEYPNYDLLGLYNDGYENQIITKPHNMYMQIGVCTGVVSLICVLVFYMMYFFPGMKLYMHMDKFDKRAFTGVGILAGSFGYMVTGMINDSCVTVAPLYWALMGMGIAIDRMVRKDGAVEICGSQRLH